MRGQVPKISLETQYTLPKQSDEEPPIQIVPDDSPIQLENPDIPQHPDEKCKIERNECQ